MLEWIKTRALEFGFDDAIQAGLLVVAILALISARRARRAAKNAANDAGTAAGDAKSAAGQADTAAGEAEEQGRRMVAALEHLAVTATERLKHVAQSDSTVPEVAWELEHHIGDRYALRNVGTETAEGVAVTHPRGEEMLGRFPTDETVEPLTSASLMINAGFGAPRPTEIAVNWKSPGSGGRAIVPVPPRPEKR